MTTSTNNTLLLSEQAAIRVQINKNKRKTLLQQFNFLSVQHHFIMMECLRAVMILRGCVVWDNLQMQLQFAPGRISDGKILFGFMFENIVVSFVNSSDVSFHILNCWFVITSSPGVWLLSASATTSHQVNNNFHVIKHLFASVFSSCCLQICSPFNYSFFSVFHKH